MTGVSLLLKEAREQNGLSLEEISQRTYIKLPYLEALENGSLERLPANVYTCGYIRQYAKVLGLDGSALVAKFQEEAQGDDALAVKKRRPAPMADFHGDFSEAPRGDYTPGSPTGNGRTNGNGAPSSSRDWARPVVPAVAPASFEAASTVPAADPDVRQARLQAKQVIGQAEREAQQMVAGARQYADEVLSQLEADIGKTLQIIRNGRQYLQSRRQAGGRGLQ